MVLFVIEPCLHKLLHKPYTNMLHQFHVLFYTIEKTTQSSKLSYYQLTFEE